MKYLRGALSTIGTGRVAIALFVLGLLPLSVGAAPVEWSDQFERDFSQFLHCVDIQQTLEYRGDLIVLGSLFWPDRTDEPTTEVGAISIRDGIVGYILPSGPIFNRFGEDKIRCGLVYQDQLVLAGSFQAAAGEPVSNIVALDPTASDPVDVLSGGLPLRVAALGSFDGDLVAGYELVSTEVSPFMLMTYDGANWSGIPFPDGVEFASVRALLNRNGSLWVGGMFLGAGEAPAAGRSVAVWDGSNWSWPGGGLRSDAPAVQGRLPDGQQGASSLVIYDGQLYAGGSFHQQSNGIWGIARYEADSWTGLPTTRADIKSLVPSSLGLVALGRFEHRLDDTSLSSRICAWDGAKWNPLGASRADFIESEMIARTGLVWEGKLWIADQSFHFYDMLNGQGLSVFDGVNWRRPLDDRGVLGWVHEILPRAGGVVLAGGFEFANGLFSPMATFWNGSDFEPMVAGLQAPTKIASQDEGFDLIEHDGELFLSGSFRLDDLGDHNVARWDGSAWQPTGDGLQTASVSWSRVSELIDYHGELLAVGYFDRSGATEVMGLARWTDGGGELRIPSVRTACVVGDELWIAGLWLGYGSGERAGLLRWNGTQWIPHVFQPSDPIYRLFSLGDHALAIAGIYTDDSKLWRIDPDSATQITDPPLDGDQDRISNASASWNGKRYFIVNSNLYAYSNGQLTTPTEFDFTVTQYPSAMHIDDSRVYVGGSFMFRTDGQYTWGLAIGEHDQSVPVLGLDLVAEASGASVQLRCSVFGDVVPDRLSVERRSVSSFWAPVATLTPQTLQAEYRLLDSEPMDGVRIYRARAEFGQRTMYSDEVEFASTAATGIPTASYLVGATPNPFNPSTRVEFVLGISGPVHVEVVGLSGRRVLSEKLGELPAGAQSWSWDGRDGSGSTVASGSYLVRIMAPDRNLVTRVQLIK